MRLFEAIVDANHRALAGDSRAGIRPADFAESLPVVVLTCFDPRLHPLMPEVLGVAESDFIWITNAGNIITGPLSSTVRSLALACAVHGGKEIAVIGHNDCRFFHSLQHLLPDHLQLFGLKVESAAAKLNEFLSRLADERKNVIQAVKFARHSPLISKSIPVHGLMVHTETGQLDWVINGYQAAPLDFSFDLKETEPPSLIPEETAPPPATPMKTITPDFKIGGDLPPIGGGLS
ncbi:MAG: hypothetical protein HY674_03655 [Chloroflexi bacterium]|nr:hypothetical protein [Chloroflexota bacterium]